ncbi:DNA mismatch repair endonuclease MutL [Pseudoalteromonas xiamenensis]
MAIEILPARLANQIAAGEVVERPASVVKELVENSLDSRATKIQIDIERGGHKLIRIRDNGSGIIKEELTLALSRHATSKLKTLDDLENIISLGFRGEALASISSVSRLTLSSKPEAQETAWQAFAEGRDMAVQVQPTSHPNGTTVEVKDLFFNTPARRKFLRTEKTEFAHIDELVKRIALSRFDVAFTLTHNGKVVRQYRSNGSVEANIQRVAQVAGKAFLEQAAFLESGTDGLTLFGWLMPVGTAGTTQYTYVNGRMMRDKLIQHAIRQAYEEIAGSEEVPSFVLYLVLDPRQVDVNVHPAKHEVRFHQARLIHDFIVQAVKQVVSSEQHAFGEIATNAVAENEIETPSFELIQSESRNFHTPEFAYAQEAKEHREFVAPLTRSFGSTSGARSGGGYTASHKSTHQYNVNRLYQELDVPSHPRENESVDRISEAQPTTASKLQDVLPVVGGLRLWTQSGVLFGVHYREALPVWWQNVIESDGALPSKALLLPVRVAIEERDSASVKLQEATLALIGFEIHTAERFVIVKKTPPSLYQLDAAELIQRLLAKINRSESSIELSEWFDWMAQNVPDVFFESQAFLINVTELEKNPICIARLAEKAVKIDTNVLMTQILDAK